MERFYSTIRPFVKRKQASKHGKVQLCCTVAAYIGFTLFFFLLTAYFLTSTFGLKTYRTFLLVDRNSEIGMPQVTICPSEFEGELGGVVCRVNSTTGAALHSRPMFVGKLKGYPKWGCTQFNWAGDEPLTFGDQLVCEVNSTAVISGAKVDCHARVFLSAYGDENMFACDDCVHGTDQVLLPSGQFTDTLIDAAFYDLGSDQTRGQKTPSGLTVDFSASSMTAPFVGPSPASKILWFMRWGSRDFFALQPFDYFFFSDYMATVGGIAAFFVILVYLVGFAARIFLGPAISHAPGVGSSSSSAVANIDAENLDEEKGEEKPLL